MTWGDVLTRPDSLSNEMVGNAHPVDVFDWRRQEFIRLKFPAATADWLAKTRVDLTQMEDLLRAGCKHHLAIQILEGTSWSGEDCQPYPRASGADGEDTGDDGD